MVDPPKYSGVNSRTHQIDVVPIERGPSLPGLHRSDQRALGVATCHHWLVRPCRIAGLIGTAVVATWVMQCAAMPMSTAQAAPSPVAEPVTIATLFVFAMSFLPISRGTLHRLG